MVVIKAFAQNFVISLMIFLVASFIGLWTWSEILWGSYSGGLHVLFELNRYTSSWAFALIGWGGSVLTTGISIVLFFFLGKKLNLLENHLLNYLSVSGSLIIFIVTWFLQPQLIFFTTLSFVMLLVNIAGSYSIPWIFIIATLPSMIIWLGMLHQSRQKNRQKMHHQQ